MTDPDSDPEPEVVPATFLPGHLVDGAPDSRTVPVPDDGDGIEESNDSGDADAADEFCRTWRSHLSGAGPRF